MEEVYTAVVQQDGSIKIPEPILKALNLKIGDKVKFEFDETQQSLYLIPVNNS